MASRRKRDATRGGSKENLVGYGFGTTPAASRPSPPNLTGCGKTSNSEQTPQAVLDLEGKYLPHLVSMLPTFGWQHRKLLLFVG